MYNVGDVVKVIVGRRTLKDDIKHLSGSLVTISKVIDHDFYKIREDGGVYNWLDRNFAEPDFLTEPCQKTKEHISFDSLME